MAVSMDPLSTSYLSSLNSQASNNSATAKVNELKKSANSMEGATYEEIEDTMKSFESYLLEQVMKEFKDSMKEIRGDDENEDAFVSQTTDMAFDQTLSVIAAQMVDQYAQRLTKDLTDQTARAYGIEIPGEEKAAAVSEAAATGNVAEGASEEAEETVLVDGEEKKLSEI